MERKRVVEGENIEKIWGVKGELAIQNKNIDSIKNGIVIDHIQAKKGLEIYDYLKLGELDCSVAIITNAKSKKMGKKDILKIITFTVLLIFTFIYIKPISSLLLVALKLMMPFIIGLAIAFILNILVSFLESKFFSKVNIGNTSKHNLSIILSIRPKG